MNLKLVLRAAVLATLAGQATGSAAPTILGLSHVAVKATNYEESVAFYRDFLGFAEQGRLNYLDSGQPELTFLKINDRQSIEVFVAATVRKRTGKLYHYAFQVRNIDALRVRAGAAGLKVPSTTPRGQMKNANFTIQDASGNYVEFVEYLPDGRNIRDRGAYLPPTRISGQLLSVRVPSADSAAQLKFYQRLLGLAPEPTPPGAAPAAIRLRAGEEDSVQSIELHAGGAEDQASFDLAVSDVEASRVALLKRRDKFPYRGPLTLETTANGPVMVLHDPEGVEVRLVEVKGGSR